MGGADEVPTGAPVPTLFEWAGGEAAIRRLINAFYDRVEADELLSPFFPGGVSAEHRDHASLWWGEVFGGTVGGRSRVPRGTGRPPRVGHQAGRREFPGRRAADFARAGSALGRLISPSSYLFNR